MSGYRLRLTLFLGLIVGPAGVLTFLSLRAARDESASALADVRLHIPAIRATLDARLETIIDDLTPSAPFTETADLPEVQFRFALDPQGHFVQPIVLPPSLFERTTAFATALQRGEAHEFSDGDLVSAVGDYRDALSHAESSAEEAEALDALGRVLLAMGDTLDLQSDRRQSAVRGIRSAGRLRWDIGTGAGHVCVGGPGATGHHDAGHEWIQCLSAIA